MWEERAELATPVRQRRTIRKGPVATSKTRKTVTKSAAPHKPAPIPAESATVEPGQVSGAASRLLLAAAHSGGAAAG
jgi:hypothetical protein